MNCSASLAVAIFCFSACVSLSGQELDPSHGEQLTAMSKLKPLLGRWKGGGWIEMQSRRHHFKSAEIFLEKAGGLAIFVEGLHHAILPDGKQRVVHDAVAMINYKPELGRYRFSSQLANGRAGDYEATLDENGDFQWVIPATPIGKMVYTISIRNGQYQEIGEIVSPSGQRKKFFEMKLTKE